MADKLNCHDYDFVELNASEARGIDEIRSIERQMAFRPMSGESRVWLIDECHQLTGAAANAFLKPLEDTPDHVYFMLATTEPQKIIRTIRTRCTEIKLSPIDWRELESLVKQVADSEQRQISDDVVDQIVKMSDGSARQALVLLHQVIGLDGDESQLAALEAGDYERQGIDLARALMQKKPWSEIAKILKNIQEDPEKVRYVVLGYATTVLLSNKPRAYLIIEAFRDNFYDSKKAGLVAACWEAHISSLTV